MTRWTQTGDDEMGDQAQDVAAQLHDGAMQEITLARLQLDLLKSGVRDDPALAEQLERLSDVLEEASSQLQQLMRSLGPGGPAVVRSSG